MLSDEVKKQKEKNPDLVIMGRAACRYCGQVMDVEIVINWGPEEAETVATELCQCAEARIYSRKMQSRANAKKRIKQLFCDDTISDSMHKDISLFLASVVDAVADNIVEKTSCDIGNGIRAVVAKTSKGNIKVQRVIKNDASYEE